MASPVIPRLRRRYDVYLSFRGADTRNTFTAHLLASFRRKGINTFIDVERPGSRQQIASTLFKAIEGSRVAVVVFSENYASSTWCLDGLSKVVECTESRGQTLIPIFYRVEPSVVRRQPPGSVFHTAMEMHRKTYPDKMQTWRDALGKASTFSGHHLDIGRNEADFVEKIAELVSSTISRPQWSYDAFLNFRGVDTRNNFISHLLANLSWKGIRTFIDDKRLDGGEQIAPALLKAIEGSRVAVVVFSENYASSSWCLEELSKIVECTELRDQTLIPVFYKVDPSVVRKQPPGSAFHTALQYLEERYPDKVQKWRSVLGKASEISGVHFDNGNEADFVEKIAQLVLKIKEEEEEEEKKKWASQ